MEHKKSKIEFKKSLALTCAEPWVCIPGHLEIMNSTRNFAVQVNIDSLTEGVHFSEVSVLANINITSIETS